MTSQRFTDRLLPTLVSLALVPGSLLVLTQAPASAAPPGDYAADAHADILDLDATLLPPLAGSLANLQVGHSRSTTTSASGTGTSSATSSNINASALFGGLPLSVDSETVTAQPTADPPQDSLVSVDLDPLVDLGVITGDVQAAWADGNACVPDSSGARVMSDSRTTLAGATVLGLPGTVGDLVGTLAEVTASETRTRTAMVDDSVGGSDIVSTATTTVGDISLLGGEVTVDVADPVVLQARSDGTDGSAGFVSPPTIVVSVGDTDIPLPLNDTPQSIALPDELEPLVDLDITAFTPTDQSADPTGRATLDALFRIDLEVLAAPGPVPVTLADLSLAVAPMSVGATAPTGGVDCGAADTAAPAVAVLTPADGSSTTDTTPEVTGTGEPGAAIVVREGGTTICTTTVSDSGTWSCTPAVSLLPGSHTFTATATDAAGNTSTATTTFSVVPDNGDTTPPAAPDITAPDDGSSVQDTTPPISGTGETGATVTVREGSTVLCTAVVRGDGTWSCTPTVPLPLGPHTVTATQADAAGNTSPADSTTFTVVGGPGNGDTDTDGDGLPDGQEGAIGTGPLDPDTDDDGLSDGQEVTGSRIRERFEVCGKKARKSVTVTSDPLVKDTDKDGLTDGREVKGYTIKQRVTLRDKTFKIGKTRSNPRRQDTDRDGLKDKVEMTGKANKAFGKDKSDPTKCDTDKGGVSDGKEVRARSNPINVFSGPRLPGTRSGRTVTDGLPGGLG